jgi:hypothetical protein
VSPLKYELVFYIREDDILHSDRRENLKSYRLPVLLTSMTRQDDKRGPGTQVTLIVHAYVTRRDETRYSSFLTVQVPVMSFKFASALAILVCTLCILALISWCGGELSLKVGHGHTQFVQDLSSVH